jgi:phosphatidylinositol phospholipase C delta
MINEYAFQVSEYPLILSIENHCKEEQQKKMAEIMKEVFKEKLFFVKELSEEFYSPETLKGKIIIKGQKKKKNDSNEISINSNESIKDKNYSFKKNNSIKKLFSSNKIVEDKEKKNEEKNDDNNITNDDFVEEINDEDDDKEEEKEDDKEDDNEPTIVSLSNIVSLDSIKFNDNFQFIENWQMHSFSETKFKKIYKKFPNSVIIHNNKYITRIYPKGFILLNIRNENKIIKL